MSGLKYSDLMKCRIGGYEPPYMHRPPFIQMGLPPFTLWTVEFMRRDYQVKIGMAIKLACLLKAKFKISGAPAEKEFCESLLRQLWLHVIPHAVSAHYYTQSACEMVYEEKKGMVQFKMCRPIYPTDWRIFTKGGNKHAIRVKTRQTGNQPDDSPIWLYGPKSFLYVHRREFGSWNGISELEGAYPSWLDKRDQQGAMQIRRLWYFKNAFDSGFILCPPGMYNAENGEKVPYRDLARQALESSMTGATWVFDNVVDAEGRPLWHFEKPQINNNGESILAYIDALDTEILRGLEIPDDVISQVSGTGSYAGRTIPLSAFFISQNQQLFWLVRELKEQIIDPIMRLNFGKDPDYQIESAEVNVDALMPSGPGEGANEDETQNTQVPPATEAENFARQQAQQSQQQLSKLMDTLQSMIDQKPVADANINGEGASLMDLPKRKEATIVYQFSGGKFDESKHPRDGSGQFRDTAAEAEHAKAGHVPFFHTTDIRNAMPILEHGLKPRVSRELEVGEEPPAVYFSRDDKYTSHGPHAEVKEPIVIRGKIPLDYMEKHGIVDSDYVNSKTHFQNKPEGIDPNDANWRDSYYYKGKEGEPLPEYTAAAVIAGIPADWIEAIKHKGKWHEPKEFLKKHGKRLQAEYDQAMLGAFHSAMDANPFSKIASAESAVKLYPRIKHLLPPEQQDAFAAVNQILEKTVEKFKREHGEQSRMSLASIHPYFASQVSAKTGVSPQLAASAILLGEAVHCGTAEQLANLLHLDTARKALATVATSSMDPTVVRGFDSSGMPDYTVVTSADDPSLLYRLSQGSPEGCVEQPELEVIR